MKPKKPNSFAEANHPSLPRLLSVEDVAVALGVSQKTIRRWIEKEALPHHRLGGLIRIAEVDLRTFLAMRRQVL